jgi:predicted nucleotidyltransferase
MANKKKKNSSSKSKESSKSKKTDSKTDSKDTKIKEDVKDLPKATETLNIPKKKTPSTMKIKGEREIASDFAIKVYDKFDQIIKAIILFGSSAKKISTEDSDIDVIIIIDDVAVNWDEELIAWYREELGKIIQENVYSKVLHVNTVRLSTWWDDMMRGDPVVINILRHGDPLIDIGGFFAPLKRLLKNGKIKSTPESIYTLLQRAPSHMVRAKQSMLAAVDGLYWTVVDAAHAALIAGEIMPSSPEEIPKVLDENFVQTKKMHKKFVGFYVEIHDIAKQIIHGTKTSIRGHILDEFFLKADAFLGEMARLVDKFIDEKVN